MIFSRVSAHESENVGFWLKSNHTKATKNRGKLLKGGGEARSSFSDLVLASCLLLLAPNGKGEGVPPPSTLTSCGACLLELKRS